MAPGNSGNDLDRDLGLGGRLAQTNVRLMNRDGSFNVDRRGRPWRSVFHPYHHLLTMSWVSFFGLIVVAYLLVNLAFAFAYQLCGPPLNDFGNAFFFSVQTLATIGYGKLTPEGLAANILVTIEALVGLLGFAFATGLLFARFSRPSADIVFSDVAVVAPYRDGTGLMFRMANGRSNELTNVTASVTLAIHQPGQTARKFHLLALERTQVQALATQWVVVHPIDEKSPLSGLGVEQFRAAQPEILVLIHALDEASFQTATARTSYTADEIRWGAKFRDVHEMGDDGRLSIHVGRLGETDAVELA